MFLRSHVGIYVMAVRHRSTAHPTIQIQPAVAGQATHWSSVPLPILTTLGMSLLLCHPFSIWKMVFPHKHFSVILNGIMMQIRVCGVLLVSFGPEDRS